MSNVDILDLGPALRQRKVQTCKHDYCVVDQATQSLTCSECEREIDPWWFIRRLATEHEEEHALHSKWLAEARAAELRLAERIAVLQVEAISLAEARDRLWNTRINGKPLGTQVRRPARTRMQMRVTQLETTLRRVLELLPQSERAPIIALLADEGMPSSRPVG